MMISINNDKNTSNKNDNKNSNNRNNNGNPNQYCSISRSSGLGTGVGLIKQKVLAQPVKYTNRSVAAFTTVKKKSTATLALTSSRAPGCCKSSSKLHIPRRHPSFA